MVELPDFVKKDEIDFKALHEFLERTVPTGYHLRNNKSVLQFYSEKQRNNIKKTMDNIASAHDWFDADKAYRGIGTLGDGNHYIELNENTEGKLFITVHTGSRSYGGQVGQYFEKLAASKEVDEEGKKWHEEMLAQPKKDRQTWIQENPKPKTYSVHQELTGQDMKLYLSLLSMGQNVADMNRKVIAGALYKHILWQFDRLDLFEEGKLPEFTNTIHNYFNFKDGIIRKGAISAHKGEKVIIPINMRDGSIIAIGKGNPEANFSAPHGAGRLGSRKWAKTQITLEDLEESMKGVVSFSLNDSTRDEAPMAYKSIDYIKEELKPLADIVEVIKPIFNFKHSEMKEDK